MPDIFSSGVRSLLVAVTALVGHALSPQIASAETPLPDLPFALPAGVRLTVGSSLLMLPKFEGAKSMRVTALPIFQFATISSAGSGAQSSNFDVSNIDDASLVLFKQNGVAFGPLVGYRMGRLEKDSPRLAGLGNIDGGLVAGGFAKYNYGPVFIRASLHQHVTGADTGLLGRLTVGAAHAVVPGVVVKATSTADFGSDAYMRSYFGVSTDQALRSGLRPFEAGAGLKSIGAMLSTEYAVTEQWTLLASAGYTRLLGDAARSPIVESANRIELRLGVSRAFDLSFR
jgi:MipA family protein